VLDGHGLSGDYDYVVGSDVRSAVAWAANWRRCSHVMVEKRRVFPWQRWLRRSSFERLLGLTDTLTLLALPLSAGAFGGNSPVARVADSDGVRPTVIVTDQLLQPTNRSC
jgi:hypothetical protein